MKLNLFLTGGIAFIVSGLVMAASPELPDTESLQKAAQMTGKSHYKPGTPFAAWQQDARADLVRKLGIAEKLTAPRVPLNPKIIWTRPVQNGTIIKLHLQSEKDYVLPAYLCLPSGKGPFPVWICLQGHGTGMHASISVRWQDEKSFKYDNGDRDFAIQCMERGYAALCLEQRAFGEKSCRSDRRFGCRRLAHHTLMFGETLIGNRVFDVDRGIDFIYSRQDLRQDRIGIVGNSGGGTTALYSGAILNRLTHVMPSSCFSTYRDSIIAKVHCPCNYFPGMLLWGDMGDLAGLCAPKYLVIVNGRKDSIFPIGPAEKEFARTREIFRAAGVPEQCRMVIGVEGHRFYKQDAWPVMEKFFR